MDSLERNSNLGKIQPWNREFKDAEKKRRDEFGDRGFYSTQTWLIFIEPTPEKEGGAALD